MSDCPFVPVSAYYTPEYREALAEIDQRRALVQAAQRDLNEAALAVEALPFVPASAYYTRKYREALAEIDQRRALVIAAQRDLRDAVLAADALINANKAYLDEPKEEILS